MRSSLYRATQKLTLILSKTRFDFGKAEARFDFGNRPFGWRQRFTTGVWHLGGARFAPAIRPLGGAALYRCDQNLSPDGFSR
jgi:hypothetical protein